MLTTVHIDIDTIVLKSTQHVISITIVQSKPQHAANQNPCSIRNQTHISKHAYYQNTPLPTTIKLRTTSNTVLGNNLTLMHHTKTCQRSLEPQNVINYEAKITVLSLHTNPYIDAQEDQTGEPHSSAI